MRVVFLFFFFSTSTGLHWCQPDFDKVWLSVLLYKEMGRGMIKAPERQRREKNECK